MCSLFSAAEKYCDDFDVKKLSLMKICCMSLGVALGTLIPERNRKSIMTSGLILFVLTYLPLMFGFLKTLHPDEADLFQEELFEDLYF